jgi:large subunit ribosomal protein L32
MGVPKKRTSKMRRNRRRAANFKVEKVTVSTCPNCKEPIQPHTACRSCGEYRGRAVTEAREQ